MLTDERPAPTSAVPAAPPPMAGRARPLVVLAAAVVLIHVVVSLAMRVPIIHTDEFAYLSTARYFAGVGPLPQVEYHPGYGLLLAPVAFVIRDRDAFYHAVLVLNALLSGATVVLVHRLLVVLGPALAERRRLIAVAVVALYPGFALLPNVAMSDNLLIPAVLAVVLAAHSAFALGTARAWATLGALTGGLYVVHARTLAVIVAVVLVAALVLRARGMVVSAASAGFGFALVGTLAAGWVLVGVSSRDAPAAVKADSAGDALGRLLSLSGIGGYLVEMAGQLLYLSAGTYGLFPLGLLVAVRGGVRAWRGERDPLHLTAGLVAVLTVATVALSSLYLSDGARLDHHIYGRYNENVLAPVLALGVVVATGSSRRPHPRVVAVRLSALATGSVVVLAALVALTRSPADFDAPIVRLNVAAADHVLALFPDRWTVAALAVLGIPGSVIVTAAARRWRDRGALAAGALFLVPLVTGTSWMVGGSAERADQRRIPAALNRIARLPGAPDCVAYDEDTFSFYFFFHYRWFADGYEWQVFDSTVEDDEPCSDLVVSGRYDLAAEHPGSHAAAIEEGGSEVLWVLPGDLQDRLMAEGLIPGA